MLKKTFASEGNPGSNYMSFKMYLVKPFGGTETSILGHRVGWVFWPSTILELLESVPYLPSLKSH